MMDGDKNWAHEQQRFFFVLTRETCHIHNNLGERECPLDRQDHLFVHVINSNKMSQMLQITTTVDIHQDCVISGHHISILDVAPPKLQDNEFVFSSLVIWPFPFDGSHFCVTEPLMKLFESTSSPLKSSIQWEMRAEQWLSVLTGPEPVLNAMSLLHAVAPCACIASAANAKRCIGPQFSVQEAAAASPQLRVWSSELFCCFCMGCACVLFCQSAFPISLGTMQSSDAPMSQGAFSQTWGHDLSHLLGHFEVVVDALVQ